MNEPLYNLAKEVLAQDKQIKELKEQITDLTAALDASLDDQNAADLFRRLGEAREECAALIGVIAQRDAEVQRLQAQVARAKGIIEPAVAGAPVRFEEWVHDGIMFLQDKESEWNNAG